MPYNVGQRTNINLLDRFNEAADRPSNISTLRRSNAITREEEEAFNNRGYIGAQMMRDYPDPFDSPPRVGNDNLNIIPGAPRRGQRPPRR
jgi:hypothetical protein